LLHSAGALVPFWAALGVVGLRDVLEWVARRRRNWKPNAAMRVFGPALLVFAVLLIAVLQARHMDGPSDNERAAYAEADALLPAGARLFTIDPPEAWYVSGRGGAVIPQAPPERLLEVATRFDIRYLLAREGEVPGMMRGVFTAPTAFLREIPLQTPDWTLYEIVAETPAGS
jgi:hypothetical protein